MAQTVQAAAVARLVTTRLTPAIGEYPSQVTTLRHSVRALVLASRSPRGVLPGRGRLATLPPANPISSWPPTSALVDRAFAYGASLTPIGILVEPATRPGRA